MFKTFGHRSPRGFTLIELLVVIAIIGILAGIVLVSLGTARNKGNDAKVEGQLSSIRNQAEIIYSNNNSYGTADPSTVNCPAEANTLPGDTSVANIIANMPAGTVSKCTVTATSRAAYAVASSLQGTGTAGDYWCVDSTGVSKKINITTIGNVVMADDTCAEIDAR